MTQIDELTEDPCRGDTSSGARTLAFVLLFFAMLGCAMFVISNDSFYLVQIAGIIAYTAAVMIYGFARNRGGNLPYLFTCPVVVSQYPRLLRRHAVFLAVLVAFATTVIEVKSHLSDWWTTAPGRSMTPLYLAVSVLIGALALAEVMTNRGVLERAHNDRFGEPPAPETTDGTLSIFPRDQ